MSWKTWNHIPDQEVSEKHRLEKLLVQKEARIFFIFTQEVTPITEGNIF